MTGVLHARKDVSVDEPIRLICPRCQTPHRVRSVVLGKRYHCKRCGAGLETVRPAVLRCRACGLSRPAAPVPVSVPHVCDRCISKPLLELAFPPPGVTPPEPTEPAGIEGERAPLAEADGREAARAPEPAPASAGRSEKSHTEDPSREGEPLSSTGPGQPDEPSPDERGEEPAPEGTPRQDQQPPALREERAFRALRQVVEEIQSPLVAEIERSRRSLPAWVQVAAAVALLLLAGVFYSAMREWRRQALSSRAALDQVRASYEENLRTLTIARASFEADREQLRTFIDDLETRLDTRRAQAQQFYERAQAYREMLIAAGFNPDLIPLESGSGTKAPREETPEMSRDAGAGPTP